MMLGMQIIHSRSGPSVWKGPNYAGPSSGLHSVPNFPRSGRHRVAPKGETIRPWQDRISQEAPVGRPDPTEQYHTIYTRSQTLKLMTVHRRRFPVELSCVIANE